MTLPGYPSWLALLAQASLAAAVFCALVVALHILAHPQRMWIMNVVWPVTALYSGIFGLIFYFTFGKLSAKKRPPGATQENQSGAEKPAWAVYAVATSHCGAGCTLGDIVAESLALAFPAILFFLGYQSLWQEKIFSGWILDFIIAYIFGIFFQYFTIVPMRKLSPARGLIAAMKADTLSLLAWQIGMYGWMAIATFGIFGHELEKTEPLFWFMMQIAMLCGAATSYPVNIWLLKSGLKEKM